MHLADHTRWIAEECEDYMKSGADLHSPLTQGGVRHVVARSESLP